MSDQVIDWFWVSTTFCCFRNSSFDWRVFHFDWFGWEFAIRWEDFISWGWGNWRVVYTGVKGVILIFAVEWRRGSLSTASLVPTMEKVGNLEWISARWNLVLCGGLARARWLIEWNYRLLRWATDDIIWIYRRFFRWALRKHIDITIQSFYRFCRKDHKFFSIWSQFYLVETEKFQTFVEYIQLRC